MKKAEIIAGSLTQVWESDSEATFWTGPEVSYEAYFALTLGRRLALLSADNDILTCPDFTDFKVECCPIVMANIRINWTWSSSSPGNMPGFAA